MSAAVTTERRYDVVYGGSIDHPYCGTQPHFCREIDCFGSNKEHGYTWKEARKQVAAWYRMHAKRWECEKEPK